MFCISSTGGSYANDSILYTLNPFVVLLLTLSTECRNIYIYDFGKCVCYLPTMSLQTTTGYDINA